MAMQFLQLTVVSNLAAGPEIYKRVWELPAEPHQTFKIQAMIEAGHTGPPCHKRRNHAFSCKTQFYDTLVGSTLGYPRILLDMFGLCCRCQPVRQALGSNAYLPPCAHLLSWKWALHGGCSCSSLSSYSVKIDTVIRFGDCCDISLTPATSRVEVHWDTHYNKYQALQV